jgi:protein disulfide-isomerase
VSQVWFRNMAWCAAILAFMTLARAAEPEGWITDFEQAKKAAAEKKLPILMDFSGSDWCIWCKRLDSEVFTQKAFKDYAKDNLVLFMADFPMRSKQSEELRKQNIKLQSSYRVAGYPTVILVDAQGQETARTGYEKGGAENYVEHLKGLLAGKKEPDPAGAAGQ